MYFSGICIVGQAGQWHAINAKLIEVVIKLRLYGVVKCRRLHDNISEGNSILANNGQQVFIECPVLCDPVLVTF